MSKKPDQAVIERTLMALVEEAVAAEETAKRIRIQVEIMAKEYGIKMPTPEQVR